MKTRKCMLPGLVKYKSPFKKNTTYTNTTKTCPKGGCKDKKVKSKHLGFDLDATINAGKLMW
jgi:hypothetical protein